MYHFTLFFLLVNAFVFGQDIQTTAICDTNVTTFYISTSDKWEALHWQISRDENFQDIIGPYDVVEPFTKEISVEDLPTSAHFRVRGISRFCKSSWTKPESFTYGQEIWDSLCPYFIPDEHPIKSELDSIFSNHHVLASRDNFKKAGFKLLKHPKNRMIIAKHKKLKGYLIKAFLDSEPNTEWEWWKKRIDGAQVIQNSINAHGFQSIMKVPKKWIYPLPECIKTKRSNIPKKGFVLVVEDMKLLSTEDNLKAFKYKMTKPLLNALYVILTENQLIDSIYADNIPFSKDGRIAFIDTEHWNDYTQPVRLWLIAQYLTPELHAYWDQVLQHGRPL